ncbi:hypothetical protein [Carnobacterium sp. 1290_CSPC]|uniref:hypothetical protein n=1 Tax=Carnobacterium sp. 1290_CSPC TaxID=1579347 RepID=UPI00178D01C8|nr:hypothetical protein [Carnobacterium sp. 1290_CSPC]
MKFLKIYKKEVLNLLKTGSKLLFCVKKSRNYAFSTKSAKNSKILGKCGEKWGDMVDLYQ